MANDSYENTICDPVLWAGWRGGAVGAVADNVNENDAVNCGPRGGATGKLTSDVIRGPDKAEFTEEHPDVKNECGERAPWPQRPGQT